MLFLGILHLQAFCCLLISLKMERMSWAGSLHGAEPFPVEQLPSGHGNQKYTPAAQGSAEHPATEMHIPQELALAKLLIEYDCIS